MSTQNRNTDVTTGWVALPKERCVQVTLKNNSGADLLVARTSETADATKYAVLKDTESELMLVQNDCAEISIKGAGAVAAPAVSYTLDQ